MKKPSSVEISKFVLFASPSYWLLALMFIALAVWKVGFNEPDLISLAGLNIAITVAAVFLVKKRYWVSIPMILLGISFSFMGFI